MTPRFEQLEIRTALSHGVADHIHATLNITIEETPELIPANIGLVNGHFNPHTHSDDGTIDSKGILHIGEGGPAGLSGTVRHVALKDFFDVWREVGGATGKNTDAVFSKNEIMGQFVDRHHELTMYVNGTENNEMEAYIPHDDDEIAIVYSRISWAWQNYDEPMDVSDDGQVSPRDALHIINEINKNGAHPIDASTKPDAYYDVSGDDFVSSIDALRIIRHLNLLSEGL